MLKKIAVILITIALTVVSSVSIAGSSATALEPILMLLLDNAFPKDVSIEVGRNIQVSKGTDYIDRFHVYKVFEDVSDDYLFSIEGDYPNIELSEQGIFTYAIPENEVTGEKRLTIRVTEKKSQAYKEIEFPILVLDTDVVASGVIGPQGGIITDEWEDVVLTIPPNAVEKSSLIQVIRTTKENGYYNYSVDSSEPLQELLDLRTPRQVTPAAPAAIQGSGGSFSLKKQNSAEVQMAGSEENEWIKWKDWPADYLRVARLDLTDDPVNRVKTGKDVSSLAHRFLKLEKQPDASSLYSLCGSPNTYRIACGDKEPVLFVHGFSPDAEDNFKPGIYLPYGQGGGEDTWGNLPRLISDDTHSVFEFRWRTNSTFKDAADDLASAIKRITKESNKKVHIVAHSFGGLLARTYLQNYARTQAYADDVQSLITFGTPHSGIFDNDGVRDGVQYYNGQDNTVGMFETCMQSSCNQAGEPTPKAYKIPAKVPLSCSLLPGGIYTDQCHGDLYNPENRQLNIADKLGVNPEEGELVKQLQALTAGHKIPVNTMVLMGLTIDRKDLTCLDYDLGSWISLFQKDEYESGDGLITFAGQRFISTLGKTPVDWVTPIYTNNGIYVKEKILGTTDPQAAPEENLRREDSFLVNNGDCIEHIDFEGYRHSGAFGLATARGDASEVNVVDTEYLMDTGAPHAAYTEIVNWLSLPENTSQVHAPSLLTITTRILDANSSVGIPAAKVFIFANGSYVGDGVSNNLGDVELEVDFIPNTEYSLAVSKEGYHPASFFNNFTTEDDIASSPTDFGAIKLQNNVVEYGILSGNITDTGTGATLQGALISLERNGLTREDVADSSGGYSIDNLVAGHYRLTVSKSGYDQAVSYFNILGNVVNNSDIGLNRLGVDVGLTAHYQFDGDASDSTANSYNGTTTGGVSFGTIQGKSVASFDGVNDAFSVGSIPHLNEFTFSLNMRINSLKSRNPLVDKHDEYNFVYEDGKLKLYIKAGDSIGYNGEVPYSLELGRWYHLAVTFDGQTASIYEGGQLIHSFAVSGDINSSPYPLYLLSDQVGIYHYSNADISSFSIYDRALPSSEL